MKKALLIVICIIVLSYIQDFFFANENTKKTNESIKIDLALEEESISSL